MSVGRIISKKSIGTPPSVTTNNTIIQIVKRNQLAFTKFSSSLSIPLSLYQVTDEHIHTTAHLGHMINCKSLQLLHHYVTSVVGTIPFLHYMPLIWQWFNITKDCCKLTTCECNRFHISRILRTIHVFIKRKSLASNMNLMLNVDQQLFLLRTFFIVYRMMWMFLEMHGVKKGDDIMCCILDYVACFADTRKCC